MWVRGNSVPTRVKQTFVQSTDPRPKRERFVKKLPERIWGETALIVCGETNILKIPRGSQLAQMDPVIFF